LPSWWWRRAPRPGAATSQRRLTQHLVEVALDSGHALPLVSLDLSCVLPLIGHVYIDWGTGRGGGGGRY
jgi:hypothetical protein